VDDEGLAGWAIALIVIVIVVLILGLIIGGVVFYRFYFQKGEQVDWCMVVVTFVNNESFLDEENAIENESQAGKAFCSLLIVVVVDSKTL
jgi:predicted permease